MNYLVEVLVEIQGVSTSGCIFCQTLCGAVSVTPYNCNCDYYFCNTVKIYYLVLYFPNFQSWTFEIGAGVGVPVYWHPKRLFYKWHFSKFWNWPVGLFSRNQVYYMVVPCCPKVSCSSWTNCVQYFHSRHIFVGSADLVDLGCCWSVCEPCTCV